MSDVRNIPDQSDTEIAESDSEASCNNLPPLKTVPWGQWTEDDIRKMVVRGPNFLKDKVKIESGPPIFKLMHLDIFVTANKTERAAHIASNPQSWGYKRWEKQEEKKKEAATDDAAKQARKLSPTFIINFMLPPNMHLVLYYERIVPTADELKKNPNYHHPRDANYKMDIDRVAAFDRVLEAFLDGTDDFRDGRLKIVPRIAEGGWMVKKAVGRVPAVLGRKVKQFYHYNEERNYMEIDVDLGTSAMAGKILQLVKGTCKSLIVDLSFILQGESPAELPESLMSGVRMVHVNIDKVSTLEENEKTNGAQFPED